MSSLENPIVVAESECKAINLFKKRTGIYAKKTKAKYSRFDAICPISKTLLEVKNRNCNSTTYPTSIFPENKIKSWKKHFPDYSLFFICCYKNGTYFYQFNDVDELEVSLGGRRDRGKDEIKNYYYIPISLFKKFD